MDPDFHLAHKEPYTATVLTWVLRLRVQILSARGLTEQRENQVCTRRGRLEGPVLLETGAALYCSGCGAELYCLRQGAGLAFHAARFQEEGCDHVLES